MRRVVYTETGGPEVLQLIEEPVPEPGPGEVRVRMVRSGVNPTDWKSRRGVEPGRPVQPAQTPGHDGAGVVDAVGEGVAAPLLGLRVWIWEAAFQRPYGTAAEFALVPERQVVTLPDLPEGDPYDLGAALGVPFVTAHRCLTVAEYGPLRLGPGALAGRSVLVAGGAGAVGNAAIQLARWSDALVLATVSGPRKAQLAAAAGAHHVIDYTTTDVAGEVRKIRPHGVDVVVEVAAAQNAGLDSAALAVGGTVAIYADNGGADMSVPIRPSMITNARWQFVLLYTAPAAAKERAVADISAAVLAGAVRTGDAAGLPLQHFPLAEAAAAHAAVEGGAVGKVLIDI